MTYTLSSHGNSIIGPDGAFIPADPSNTDYAAYLRWVKQGNTATPAAAAQPSAIELADAIDTLVASIYSNWTRFEQEYLLRAQAAQTFKDAGYEGDPGPWVSAFATAAGMSNTEAAERILAQSVSLNGALVELGALRMRKYEVLNAATPDAANAAYLNVVAAINAVAATIQ
jgi:hypothetical protein